MAPPTPESDIASLYESPYSPGCVRSRSHNCCFLFKAGAKRSSGATETSSKAKKFKPNQSTIQNDSVCSLRSTNGLNKSDIKSNEIISDGSEINFSGTEVGYLSGSCTSEDEESTDPYQKFREVNQPLKPAKNQSQQNIIASVSSSRSNLSIKGPEELAVHLTPKSYTVSLNGSLSSLNMKNSRLNSSFTLKEDPPISQEKIVSKEKTFKSSKKKKESSIFPPKLSNKFQNITKKTKLANSALKIENSSPGIKEKKELRIYLSKTINFGEAEDMNSSHSCSSRKENLINPSQNISVVNQAGKASKNQPMKSISASVSIPQSILPSKGLEELVVPPTLQADTESVRRSLRRPRINDSFDYKGDVRRPLSQAKKVNEAKKFKVDENKEDSSFNEVQNSENNKLKKLPQVTSSALEVKKTLPEIKEKNEIKKCVSITIDDCRGPEAGGNLSDSCSSDEEELKGSQQKTKAVNQAVNAKESQSLKNIKALVSSCKSLLPMKEILSSGVKDVTDTRAQRKLFETISPSKTLSPIAQTDSQTNPRTSTDSESNLVNLRIKAPESQFTPISPHNSLQTFQGAPSISALPQEEISQKGISSNEKSFEAQSEETSLEQNEKSHKGYYKKLLPLEPNKSNDNKRNMLDSKLQIKYQQVIGSPSLSSKEADVTCLNSTLDEIFKYCDQVFHPLSPLPAHVNEDKEGKSGSEPYHNSQLNNKSCEESAGSVVESEISFLSKSKTAITGYSTNVDTGSGSNSVIFKDNVKSNKNNLECSILDLKAQKNVSFDRNGSSDKQNGNVNEEEQGKNSKPLNVNNLTDLKEKTHHPVDSLPKKPGAPLNTAASERTTNSLSRYSMRQISVPKYFCKNQIVPRPCRTEQNNVDIIKTKHEDSKLFKPLVLTKQKARDLLNSDEMFKNRNQFCHPLSPLPAFNSKNEECNTDSKSYQNSHFENESCIESTIQSLEENKISFQLESEAVLISDLNSEDIGSSFNNILIKTESDEILERSTQSKYTQENVKSHSECSMLDLSKQKSVSFGKNIISEEQIVNELDKSCTPLTKNNSNEKTLSKSLHPECSSPNKPDLNSASSQRSPNSLSRYNMRQISVPKYFQIVPRSPKFGMKVVEDIIIKHDDSKLFKPVDSIKQEAHGLLDSSLPTTTSQFAPKTPKIERKLVEETETNHGDFEWLQRISSTKLKTNSLFDPVLPKHHEVELVCKNESEDVMPSLALKAHVFPNIIGKQSKDLKNRFYSKKNCSYYMCNNQPNPKNVFVKLPENKIKSPKVPLKPQIPSDNIRTENSTIKIDLPQKFILVDSTQTSYEGFSSLNLNEYFKSFDKYYGKELYLFASGQYYASRRKLHQKSYVYRKTFTKMKNSQTKMLNTIESRKKDDKEDIVALISETADILDMSEKPNEKLDYNEKPFTEHVLRKTFTDSISESKVSQESKSNSSPLAVTKQNTEVAKTDWEVTENQPTCTTSTTTNTLDSHEIIDLEEEKFVDDDGNDLMIDISDDEEDNIHSKTNPYCSTSLSLQNCDIKSNPATTSCMSLSTSLSAILKTTETKPNSDYCPYMDIVPTFNSSSTKLSVNNPKPFSRDCMSALPKVDFQESSNKEIECEFLPKFYTEPETKTNVSSNTDKEEIENNDNIFTFPKHRIFKKNALNELAPQGEKIKLTGNLLQTAIDHHKNNLDGYTRKNITEKRKVLPKSGEYMYFFSLIYHNFLGLIKLL